MSGYSNHKHTGKPPTATSRPNFSTSHDTRQHLARLDARLELLVNKKLPRAPYLISVPSDVPYRHNPHFVNNWHLATPFTQEEESLQYMSFLTYQDPEQSLIKAVGGWSDDKGNLLQEDPSSQDHSAVNSPLPGNQRKKITLNDYKSKTKEAESPAKKENVMGGPVQRPSESAEATRNGVSEKGTKDLEAKPAVQLQRSRELKRSSEELDHPGSMLESSRPEKKPRTKSPLGDRSPRRSAPSTQSTQNAQEPSPRTDRIPSLVSPTLPMTDHVPSLVSPTLPIPDRIPSLVSPTLPLLDNAHDVLKIPALLSPTLPLAIEQLLQDSDTREDINRLKRRRSNSAQSSSGPETLDSPPLPAAKKAHVLQANQEIHPSPSSQSSLKEAKVSPGARGRDPTSSPGPRRRHTIVLKYGKRNRKRVEALLKFAPRSKKQIPKRVEAVQDEDKVSSKVVERSVPRSHERNGQQARGGVTSHPSASPPTRRKVPPSTIHISEKPTTPIPAAFKSPSLQNSLLPRSTLATPKKDLKSTAMRRVESSDGVDARTPPASMTRQSTPASIERPQLSNNYSTNHINSNHKPHPSHSSSPPDTATLPSHRDESRRAWKAFHATYHDLGRTIKHEGASLLQQDDGRNKKKGVLLTIEALLCFMLSQTTQSCATNGSDPGWRTMLPYLSFVRRVSNPFPPLYGLVSQLGAVCRQAIQRHDLDRLAREFDPPAAVDDDAAAAAAPQQAPSSGPPNLTPSSDVERQKHQTNTNANANANAAKKAQRRWHTFRTDLTDNIRDLHRLWLDGFHCLDPYVIETDFPRTWAERATVPSSKKILATTPASASASSGSSSDQSSTSSTPLPLPLPLFRTPRFHLPLDANTGVTEAVKFANCLLAEWARKENVGGGGGGGGGGGSGKDKGWKGRVDHASLPPP